LSYASPRTFPAPTTLEKNTPPAQSGRKRDGNTGNARVQPPMHPKTEVGKASALSRRANSGRRSGWRRPPRRSGTPRPRPSAPPPTRPPRRGSSPSDHAPRSPGTGPIAR